MRLQSYILNESKGVTLVRFGGLSSVDQKKYGINKDSPDSFHYPPENKGIYAFIWPYIEPFLFAWKIKYGGDSDNWKEKYNKFRRDEMRKFQYDGYLWTHFTDVSPKYIRRRKDNWAEIHSSDLEKVLRLSKHRDMIDVYKHFKENYGTKHKDIKDPYKVGLKGNHSKDHLEVFIKKAK